ncbi:glycosyltransferase family 2 protein [Dokdonia ponticola]|uniref:Glycosyltransferase family 2 protein n=1 Tax=Dokdonia ponticola TaxID=2041041 RepID=A0ABV9I3J2_9FLAO
MRKGINPQKNSEVTDSGHYHKVIVPVYIPHQEDYYKDAFSILKVCLETLTATVHGKTLIAVADNGSCDAVIAYLQTLYVAGTIQELSVTRMNVGKVNSIYKTLAGDTYPLVTVSDADVYFYHGWQEAVERIYMNFENVGAVCPTPSSRSYGHMTQPVWLRYLWSKQLKFEKNPDPEGMISFGNSLGNPDFYNKVQLEKTLVLRNNSGEKAVLGAGHYVATYRGDILKTNLQKATSHTLGAKMVQEYIDRPVYESGLYRLSTMRSYATHMGNVYEPWMDSSKNSLEKKPKEEASFTAISAYKQPGKFKMLLYKMISKGLKNKKIGTYVFKKKGLTAQEAKEYLS